MVQAQTEVNAQKTAITGLAGERDVVEKECRDLAERLEAAKAELNRWQREQEQIQRQLAPPPSVVVDITNTTEQQKTLRSNLKVIHEIVNIITWNLTRSLLCGFDYQIRSVSHGYVDD